MSAEKQITKACALHERALQARAQGDFAEALSFGQRALRLLEDAEGASHPDVANVLNHLGATHADCGDFAKAEKLHRRALEIMEQCVREVAANSLSSRSGRRGPGRGGLPGRSCGDPDLDRLRVHSLNGLGTVYRMAGRYADARPLFEKALALAEDAFGPDDLEVATVLNNLGVLGKFAGWFTKAEKAYRRALRIVETAHGVPALAGQALEHPGALDLADAPPAKAGTPCEVPADAADLQNLLATLYHNLGGLEHARGRCAAGEPFARRSVELRERVRGPDHPAVAEDAAALAALLDGQGKFDEAERLYRGALAMFERVRGHECYDVAVNLNNLAAIQQNRGHFPEAERLYRRSLALKEKLLGTDHPDTGMTLHNLAVCYRDSERVAEARPLALRALAVFEKTLGRAHPHTRAARENLEALRP